MAAELGIAAGITDVIGFALQITQTVVKFGLNWKDAPAEAKEFREELAALAQTLSQTQNNIIQNPDFAAALDGAPSILLSELGADAAEDTDTLQNVRDLSAQPAGSTARSRRETGRPSCRPKASEKNIPCGANEKVDAIASSTMPGAEQHDRH